MHDKLHQYFYELIIYDFTNIFVIYLIFIKFCNFKVFTHDVKVQSKNPQSRKIGLWLRANFLSGMLYSVLFHSSLYFNILFWPLQNKPSNIPECFAFLGFLFTKNKPYQGQMNFWKSNRKSNIWNAIFLDKTLWLKKNHCYVKKKNAFEIYFGPC